MPSRLGTFLWAFAVVGVVVSQDVSQLESHLSHFTQPRNPSGSQDTRDSTRSYIAEQMSQYGLTVQSHPFNTQFVVNSNPQTIKGENVIGISKGKGGPDDKVLVLGADFDTGLGRHPLEDNGAGVAVLLETARNFMKAIDPDDGPFEPTGTIVFVAFDLNTKEYGSSAGQPGSYHFLHQWLWPYLTQNPDRLVGAFILDSVSRFNHENESQHLPEKFVQTFPDAYKNINDDGMKGNFLAAFIRNSSVSHTLVQALNANYFKERKAMLIRLVEMTLTNGAKLDNNVFSMFNHQAHLPFWTFHSEGRPVPLPAILLTDTDIYRKSVNSDLCADPCTAEKFLTRRRKTAMTISTSALTHLLLNLQATRRSNTGDKDTDSNSGHLPTLAITSILVTLARLII